METVAVEENDLRLAGSNYERMMAELRKIAEEKPSLRMINSEEIKTIKEWRQRYPELWLLIEVTREDFHQIYEGKLIATAENSVEFFDIKQDFRRRGIVNYTTRGVSIGEQPIFIPTCTGLEVTDKNSRG